MGPPVGVSTGRHGTTRRLNYPLAPYVCKHFVQSHGETERSEEKLVGRVRTPEIHKRVITCGRSKKNNGPQ